WMTAASGIVHQEFHGPNFARTGGPFEMVQLWVNLAAKNKKAKPGYQNIAAAQIPTAELPDGAGSVRVIAGHYGAAKGPAHTFSPMNVWDVRLRAGKSVKFSVTEGHTASFLVLKGRVRLPGGEEIGEAEMAVLERNGDTFAVEALTDATLLVLT